MPIYLDYNASSPIDPRVLNYMVDVYKHSYGNADSRTHYFGTKAKEIVSNSRNEISKILNIDNTELIFTSGSTESNNMAILGMLKYAISSGRNHFITTSIEHKTVLESMKYLQKNGCLVDFINPDRSGRVNSDQILSKVTDKTLLVSIMHVNNETGIIQPVEDVGKFLKQTGTYFHIDATQSFGKMNDIIREFEYDLLSFSGHKLGGPQGIGGLVIRRRSDFRRPPLAPLFYGGQQERGLRPGTTPVALVAGLAMAAKICEDEYKQNNINCLNIKKSFIESIQGLNYQVNGDQRYCIPNTINISFNGIDAEAVFVAVKNEYSFSNGSACTSGNFAPSYVLSAMGLDDTRILSALRLSWDGRVKVDFTNLINYLSSLA